jgi:hypothetical protein
MSEPPDGNGEEKNDVSAPSIAGYGTPFKSGPAPMSHWNWEVTQEKEWHRPCAVLAARGVGIGKIAQSVGRCRQAVANLFRQPWFTEMVNEELREARQDVAQLFRNEVTSNLAVLASIRDDENAPTNARVLSAKELNDRALGRPVQPIATAQFLEPDVSSDNVVETVARLERETDALYAKRHGLPAAQPQNDDTDDVNDAD